MNKYEQLIEFIINDDSDKARELFHEIVVEKSRDIYESLIDEADLAEVGGNEVEELVDEVTLDETGMNEEEEEASEFDAEEESGEEEFGGEEQEEAEIEDRVVDLEAALDELKAEFDALMADEANEPEHHDGIDDPEFGGEQEVGQEFGGEEEEVYEAESCDEDKEEEEEAEEVDESLIREYVELAGVPYKGDNSEGKLVGKDGSVPVNTKNPVAGKNDMGGTAAFTKGGNQNQDGNSPTKANNYATKGEGQLIGKVQNTAGGTKKLSTAGKAYEKSTGQQGKLAGNDGSVAQNTKSPLKAR